MKTLMITVVMIVGLNSCEVPGESISGLGMVSTSSLDLIGPNEGALDKNTIEKIENIGESLQSGCFFTNRFSAELFTVFGSRILASNVQTDTEYIVRVRLDRRNVPCCYNVAYCVTGEFGFRVISKNPADSDSGNHDFRIRTGSALIPGQGIIGIVRPIGCNGAADCSTQDSNVTLII